MAHIERYGAVYWDLIADADLEQFKDCYPMSGYLYCTDTRAVDCRVRILDISFGPKKECDIYVPTWRQYDTPEDCLFILIDHIDRVFPSCKFRDFKVSDNKPVQRQPIGGFTRVQDPLY